jgi:hypothetical protein
MLFSSTEARSLLANRHRRTPCVLLLDTSWSMEGEKIRRLNAGLRTFREDILRNPMAAQSVELCVVSFGPVKVQSEFALLRELPPLKLEADGVTPLRQALELAQEEARWQAESDLRTLRQAEEIRRDPARLKRAATMADEEMKALQAVRAIKRGR